jgi:hypothetical protein
MVNAAAEESEGMKEIGAWGVKRSSVCSQVDQYNTDGSEDAWAESIRERGNRNFMLQNGQSFLAQTWLN